MTSTVVEFIPIFTSKKYCKILTDSLQFVRKNKNIKIIAYVVMDNHFHAILNGEDLADKVRTIKGYTAYEIIRQLKIDKKNWILNQLEYYKKKYKIKSKHQVWQEGVHPQLIESQKVALQKINYIHNNPVKRGLVAEPEYWLFSSASNYINGHGVIEIDKYDEY